MVQNLIYIHLIFFHDLQQFWKEGCAASQVFRVPFNPTVCQLLNARWTSYTTLVEKHFTAVLQSKHILREPWLCVSDYVQPSFIQVGWEKWAFIKRLYNSRQKTEDFTLQLKKMWIKLWVETGWIPFLNSAIAGTKKVLHDFTKHTDNKTFPNGDGNKL